MGILEVHPMKKCAFAEVVDAHMLLTSLCVQPDTHNIMIVRGQDNLTKLFDGELKSPDNGSKGKGSCHNEYGGLGVSCCLVADGQKPLLIRREQDLLHIRLVAAEEDRLVAQVPNVHLKVWVEKGKTFFVLT